MALSKTVTLASGVTVPNAYIRVDTLAGTKSGLDCTVNVYASQAAFMGGDLDTPEGQPKPFIAQALFHFTPDLAPDAPNWIAQAYVWLQQDPAFTGATGDEPVPDWTPLVDAPNAVELQPRSAGLA